MNTSTQQNKVKIEELFEKLRTKLSSFEVINLEGQKIGRIKDFTLDKNRRLYMVVPTNIQVDSPVFLLSSRYIQNVDTTNRIVFVHISQVELNNLPLYQSSDNSVFVKQSSTSSQENLTKVEKIYTDEKNLPEESSKDVVKSLEVADLNVEEVVQLLEERLIVNRTRHKIGEIVVRKQIETHFVEVPVKRETLVVEKIGSETQQPVKFEQIYPEYLNNTGEFVGNNIAETPHSTELPAFEKNTSVTPEREQNVVSETFAESEVVEEEIVRLLEERLVVNRRKWKVGEVVARKEIETEIIKVPIRREKLIVEQVGTPNKIIAEIDLAGELTEIAHASSPKLESNHNTVVGEFLSPKAASNLLEAIALQKRHGCTKVRLEIVVENPELQETYQKMFDRCSTR